MVRFFRSKPLSCGELPVEPPKPAGRPATGASGLTLKSGNGSMPPVTLTVPPSAALPRPKQNRNGGVSGETAALTRYTFAFGTVGPASSAASVPPSVPVSLPLGLSLVLGPSVVLVWSAVPLSLLVLVLSSPLHPAIDAPPRAPPAINVA